ncbi:MAG: hypothetical protein EOP84_00325 [Verrucomicrobiaceae bacterium]|nr:MAG: hypothetical protein EOP84_00325 [Verrucomicrobiaceae bacterium]
MVDYSSLGPIGIVLSFPVNLAIIVFGLLAVLILLMVFTQLLTWALDLPLRWKMRQLGKLVEAHGKETEAFIARIAALQADMDRFNEPRTIEVKDC